MFKLFNKKKIIFDILDCCEEGFVDLRLKITETTIKNDYYVIDTEGNYKDDLVKLRFYLKNNMEGMEKLQNSEQSFKFYKEGIKIESMGEYSNRFLKVLIELYELINYKGIMQREIITTCVALQHSPLNLTEIKVKFKCFFNEEEEDKYAELYINFDIPNNLVEIKEKDPEYRENIIKSLIQV